MTTNPPVGPLQARIVALLRPAPRLKKDGTPYKIRKPKRVTEDDEFCASLLRQLDAFELRGIDNPAIVTLVLRVEARVKEIANVIIATSAEKHAADEFSAPSGRELARWMGISPASAHQRKTIGARIIDERHERANVTRISRTAQHKEVIKEAAKHVGVPSLDEYRARHRRSA